MWQGLGHREPWSLEGPVRASRAGVMPATPVKPRAPSLVVGQRAGRWTLVAYKAGSKKPVRVFAMWHCRCDCGAERWVRSQHLTSGASTSCGCAATKGSRPPNPNMVIRHA